MWCLPGRGHEPRWALRVGALRTRGHVCDDPSLPVTANRKSPLTAKSIAGLVVLVSLAVSGLVVWTASGASRFSSDCPRNAVYSDSSLAIVIPRADRLIPTYFHTRGERGQITGAVWLAPNKPATPGAATLKRVAVRKCGRAIAERSWGLVVQYPDLSPPAGGPTFVFIAKTHKGWALYGGYPNR